MDAIYKRSDEVVAGLREDFEATYYDESVTPEVLRDLAIRMAAIGNEVYVHEDRFWMQGALRRLRGAACSLSILNEPRIEYSEMPVLGDVNEPERRIGRAELRQIISSDNSD